MSVESTLRKAAKLAKEGNRAGAAALYREVLAKFPGNAKARTGLAALATPRAGTPARGAMHGAALGAGLIPAAKPVAPPPGQPTAGARKSTGQGRPQRRAAGGPAPSRAQLHAVEQMMARGDMRAAAAEGQRLARLFPRAPALLIMLAQAQTRLGKFDDALALYDRVLEIDPGFAGTHINKANLFSRMGAFDKAETSARAALALAPNMAQAHILLGYSLLNTGRAKEALAPFETATKLAPDVVQAHLGLGNALAFLGQNDAALAAFEKARARAPKDPDTLNNIANVLVALNRYDEGVETYEAAADLAPANTVMRHNHAIALSRLGRAEEAIDICHRIIEIDETQANAWSLLAKILGDFGDRAGAIDAIDRAREIDPDDLSALATRWSVDTLPLDHPDRERIERLADDSQVAPDIRSRLAAALFSAHDKTGDAAAAMPWIVKAKAIRARHFPYDRDTQNAAFTKLMATFRAGVAPISKDDVSAMPAPARPVFIVGMPRSGTSLVEQILASHSKVYAAGELPALGSILARLGWREGHDPRPFDRETLLEIRRSYFDDLIRRGVDKPVVTDKTPLNFAFVGPALAAMPEARVLFMQRDPRAVCWSNFSHIFAGRGNDFGNDMGDTAWMYRKHLEFLDLWQTLYPDRVTVVPYEKLTEHQEEESRKLVAAAGLDWEAACLDFHKTKRAVRTSSSGQVHRKMYTGSSEAWRRYEPWIGPILEGLEGITPKK